MTSEVSISGVQSLAPPLFPPFSFPPRLWLRREVRLVLLLGQPLARGDALARGGPRLSAALETESEFLVQR